VPNDFEQRIPHYTRRVEAKLDNVLPGSEVEPGRLHEAMRYGIFNAWVCRKRCSTPPRPPSN
jgi:hypothetical protein